MPSIFRARNNGGRHARPQAPAAPSPVVPAPIPPGVPGGWGRLSGSPPDALRELTGTHVHLLAGILLNAGPDFKNADLGTVEDAAEAYVRHLEGEVERLKKAQPRWKFTTPSAEVAEQIAGLYGGQVIVGSDPKTGKGPLGQVAREQIAAYRRMTEGEDTTPDAAGQNCPACGHLRALHDAEGCDAKVYPAHSLDGEPCPCERTPTTEDRM